MMCECAFAFNLPLAARYYANAACAIFRVVLPPSFSLSLSLKQVTDSQGHILFQKEDASSGKFSITTEDYEMFDICFTSHTQGG